MNCTAGPGVLRSVSDRLNTTLVALGFAVGQYRIADVRESGSREALPLSEVAITSSIAVETRIVYVEDEKDVANLLWTAGRSQR